MSEICLHFDNKAQREIEGLKSFYNLPSTASAIRLGLSLLLTAKNIEESNGQLVAKKDGLQTVIKLS